MNNQEAQLILHAYRPGGQDAADPLIAGALEQARRDPELQKWFAEEQAFDLRVQGKLRTAIIPPPELKASLLALQKMSRPMSAWREPVWLAVAAALVLLLGLAFLWLRPGIDAPLDSFRKTMARYSVSEQEHITFENPGMAKIQQWLKDQGLNAEFSLPAGLRGKPTEGCRVVDWNGHKAALICFVLSSGGHVDLFVMDRAVLPGLKEGDAPQFAGAGALTTAAWSDAGHIYLLASDSDKRVLQKILRPS